MRLNWMLLKWGMGNGEWGMGNGEWGMGNEKYWSAVIFKKLTLESVQYGIETRTVSGKRKTGGKNIYLSVFPEFWNY